MRTIALVALLAVAPVKTDAAAIYATPTITHPIIHIVGQINDGDEALFASVTKNLPANSAVSLNSTGGRVEAGLAIARMVRSRGFSTFVRRPPAICGSVCTAILLSGRLVVVQMGALVGFHQGNIPEATAAYVAYLPELEMTQEQIAFMTAAPFNSKLWATIPRTAALGFKWQTVFTMFAVSQCQAHYCLAVP